VKEKMVLKKMLGVTCKAMLVALLEVVEILWYGIASGFTGFWFAIDV
ncbi:hypothetical protein Tco_0057187, partial [Tanacetum coccineum]